MKRLLLTLLIPVLSSCALVDAYLMTKYDANEYRIITEIRADAMSYKSQCTDATASARNAHVIADKTQLFEFYNQHIPRNNNGIRASHNLNEIAQGLKKRYESGTPVSATFCRIKFEGIEIAASTIQNVVGNRPR